MTCFHFISFHPLPSGCIQVCLHARGSLIKRRGSLVRPPGVPDYFWICQTSCCQELISHKHPDFAQALRILQQKQNFSEIARLHAGTRQYTDFSSPRFQRVKQFSLRLFSILGGLKQDDLVPRARSRWRLGAALVCLKGISSMGGLQRL